MSDYDDITDWQKWRENLTDSEIALALLHSGPPYVYGTCYPMPRYILLHTIDTRVLDSIPNPYGISRTTLRGPR